MEEKTKFADEHYHLLFQLAFSARYHQRREAFYEFLDKTAKAIAVIFGAATVSTFLDKAHPDLKSWVSASISISSTLSLVFGLSQKARLHLDL